MDYRQKLRKNARDRQLVPHAAVVPGGSRSSDFQANAAQTDPIRVLPPAWSVAGTTGVRRRSPLPGSRPTPEAARICRFATGESTIHVELEVAPRSPGHTKPPNAAWMYLKTQGAAGIEFLRKTGGTSIRLLCSRIGRPDTPWRGPSRRPTGNPRAELRSASSIPSRI